MAKNRTCISCQEKYSYCPNCSRAHALEPYWKAEFCSEDCMTLWSTLTKFNMKLMTKEEAKDTVSHLNLKPIDSYVNCVQRDYAKVMKEDEKENKIVEPIVIESDAEPQVIVKPVNQYKVSNNQKTHEVVVKEHKK